MENELRPIWGKLFNFNWKFGLFLILIICTPRFILVLNANAQGNYKYLGLVMLVSAIAPFLFLSKYGRKKIGIQRPKKYSWLLLSLFSGIVAAVILYIPGHNLYGSSYENWYSYIGKSYNIPIGITDKDKAVMFAIMAITGMIFSPIGEELFFRGIVHSSFEKSIGDKKAAIVDASAFALTHISHFGLVFINQQWKLLGTPTIIWVSSMFLVSIVFYLFRKYSRSIVGAIVCHAGFNLGMIYCIFYLL